MRTILVVSSYHHQNTLKVAQTIANSLQAEIISSDKARPEVLLQYDVIGFGSGIYNAKHHPALLKLAEGLPMSAGGKAFLFSTDGMPRFAVKSGEYLRRKMRADHAALRQRLEAKGYTIVGDFSCAGYNTNSFLKFFGGINRGRPDAQDLQNASVFANGISLENNPQAF